jgi:hypothetical protein
MAGGVVKLVVGMRVALSRSYTRGRDMESFLAGERGTVSGIDGSDTAMVRMDQDNFAYPLPIRLLVPGGVQS